MSWPRVARGRSAPRSRSRQPGARAAGVSAGWGRRVGAHAWNRCRRMAAALEKMRMPSTTTTPVDSWAPTPSWSPRKTISAATSDVGDERHDEDLVVEDAVEQRAQAAEHRVERGDDGDRQVGLQPQRHGRARGRVRPRCRRRGRWRRSRRPSRLLRRRARSGPGSPAAAGSRTWSRVSTVNVDAVVAAAPAGSCRRSRRRSGARMASASPTRHHVVRRAQRPEVDQDRLAGRADRAERR